MENFGLKIRKKREKMRITQEEVVENTGVSRRTIINWETGKIKNPEIALLIPVANFLKIDISELFNS